MYLLIHSEEFLKTKLDYHLHPTMYLLILDKAAEEERLLEYLHPTMYLLILYQFSEMKANERRFTSHYVSINSKRVKQFD